ncbi:MAG: DUF2934 domain-containing protein [Bacteroidetes bacterium]|nr:DUF2934 domain-containing protein [Bacteroidota bacterium]
MKTNSTTKKAPAKKTTEKPAAKTRKNPKAKVASKETKAVTDEAIRQRAYEIYLERGENGGSPVTDWIQAEKELAKK